MLIAIYIILGIIAFAIITRALYLTVKFLIFLIVKVYKQKIILIIGETGVGKTSKAVADVRTYHKKMRKAQLKELKPIYQKYIDNGYSNIEIPETFIYSDIDIALKGSLQAPKLTNEDFRFEWLSSLIYNEEKQHLGLRKEFLPIGAVGVFDEIANKVDSRNSQSLDDGFSALLRLHRKYYLNFIFLYPHFIDADKRVRTNCHEIQKVIEMKVYKHPFKKKKIIASKWKYISYTGINKQANCEMGKTANKVINVFKKFLGFECDVELKTKWFFGNIFDCYESRAEISYFMKGVIKFRMKKHRRFQYSREFVQYFVKNHPAFMPEERQKRKSTIRRELKEKQEKEKMKLERNKNRAKEKANTS